MSTPQRRVFVTASPPTPNGDLHLGHLSGPYLGADVLARYQRLRGAQARYVVGTDDHQSYVPLKAVQDGSTPAAVAADYGDTIEHTLDAAMIELDHYVRPLRSPHHTWCAQETVRQLYHSAVLLEREAPAPYCEHCRDYLSETFVSGGCPHCGSRADGNVCEQCGQPNGGSDLVDPVCKRCGQTPVFRPLRRLFFPLSRFTGRLRRYWDEISMPPHVRALCETAADAGLPNIAVTHPGSWGLPVPVEGYHEQRINPWFEMAPGYLASAADCRGWPVSGAAHIAEAWNILGAHEVVQCFGYDNGFFHTALYPAVFMALGEVKLPDVFVINEFYRLDGAKFSTSRRHAIWAKDFLATEPADAVRYYLCYDRPAVTRTNFTLRGYHEVVRRELAGTWQEWLDELGQRLADELGEPGPALGGWRRDHDHFLRFLQQTVAAVADTLEPARFAPDRTVRLLNELARTSRDFGRSWDHTRGAPRCAADRQTARVLEYTAARTLASLAYPIMPGFADQLWRDLGCAGSVVDHGWPEPVEVVPAAAVPTIDGGYFRQPAHSRP
ncbi:MAG TPA: class I tRNA ligase family protein [Pseudonocardiaceae bacterium]|jgi:methionyl-tRNA synthetase|nr:class I tRNA ligase family protein [Pseudonocardiaceae bacterium]